MTDMDRQRQLAREHAERQRQRRAEQESQEAKAKRGIMLGVTAGVVAVAGVVVAAATLTGGQDAETIAASPSPDQTAAAEQSASPEPTEQPKVDLTSVTCEYRDDDSGSPAKDVGRPPRKLPPEARRAKTMTLKTNHGDIVIKLATQQAPCTINSFVFLAKKKFFDNTVCHRLAKPETAGLGLLQCGDPQAKGDGKNPTDGTGGPGYLFDSENLGGMSYGRGTVFMAMGGDDLNANGSQFAISWHDDNNQLQPVYTPFGTIIKGMDIIDKVAAGEVLINEGDITSEEGGSSAPKIPVKIKTVVIR